MRRQARALSAESNPAVAINWGGRATVVAAILCLGIVFALTVGEARADSSSNGRVYEKVSPLDKNSVGVSMDPRTLSDARLQASVDGNAVAYHSMGNFGGDAGLLTLQYVSRRDSAGNWSTKGINAGILPCTALGGNTYFGAGYQWFSDDLNWAVGQTCMGLNPGDPLEHINLYLRDTSGSSFERLSLSESDPPSPNLSKDCFIGTSSDLSHIVFQTESHLTEPQAFLYEWVKGDGLRPVAPGMGDITAGGQSMTGDARCSVNYPGDNPVSADGSRIYFSTIQGESPGTLPPNLYVREGGTTTRLVSVNERSGPDPKGNSVTFQLARKRDGGVAFFTDFQKRTVDATADEGAGFGSADLYRWEADAPVGSQLTDITTQDPDGAGVISTVLASDDATKVYFLATGDLAPGAIEGEENLYLWQEGIGVRHVATNLGVSIQQGAVDRQAPRNRKRITPSGNQLAFIASTQLTSYDTNGHEQIYLYDALSDELTCVSCNPRSPMSTADARFILTHDNKQLPHNLSDDGQRVFFESTEALVPQDTNGRRDVYEWHDGELDLISTGSSGDESVFLDASASGRDVFFVTVEQLVRSDTDFLADVYDARVGGKPEPAPIPGCSDDECQGTPVAPPVFDTPGSAGYLSSGAPSTRRACGTGQVRRKGRCVRKRHSPKPKQRPKRKHQAGQGHVLTVGH